MKHLIKIFAIIVLFVSCKEQKKEINSLNSELEITNPKEVTLAFGTLERIDSFPSKYVRPRTVDIWLPDGYAKDKSYAVLYMHDGQNLFDKGTTWNKQEWMADDIVGGLMAEGKIKNTIIVGMWNIGETRYTDYLPNKPFQDIPKKFMDSLKQNLKEQDQDPFLNGVQSDEYLKFIVDEVKPYIDSHYATLSEMENTFIAGSSMGGLISMYAICEYPDVFGGAGCLSTHWPGLMPMDNNPAPETFFNYMETHLPNPNNHKIYFDYGTETLDKHYLPYQHRVDEVLAFKGYTDQNSKNIKFENHSHTEDSWSSRFKFPVQFLLSTE